MHYSNPIIPGFYPDPSVCRVGDDFYLVNSSFEYFPGVPVFHSRDLAHWQPIGHCLTRPSQLPLQHARASGGIYAPTIRYHAGTYYMITTNVDGGGHFFVTAEDPAGPWSEPVWVEGDGIDPSLFFDEDGQVYFNCTGEGGIQQSLIDPHSGKRLGKPRMVWTGTGGAHPEAPHLYKIDGRYYLLIAEGGTEYGHMVTIARADSPWGPFESCPRNPILTHRSLNHPIQGAGHADLFADQHGRWWMVFLAFRPKGYTPTYNLGRETFLAPVTWTADGWPLVNGGQPVQLAMDAPLPAGSPWPAPPELDDFVTAQPGLAWNFLRNPDVENYDFTRRPGFVCLRGSAVTLDQPDSPTWLGRRQTHFRCVISALMDFDPQEENEEAGLTAYMNPTHHYDIGVTLRGQQRLLFVRRRIGRLAAITYQRPVPSGKLILSMRADTEEYHFGWAPEGGDTEWLYDADGERRYLSTEVAGGFTGVYFAIYATGNGAACRDSADFDWVTYREGD